MLFVAASAELKGLAFVLELAFAAKTFAQLGYQLLAYWQRYQDFPIHLFFAGSLSSMLLAFLLALVLALADEEAILATRSIVEVHHAKFQTETIRSDHLMP